MTESPETKPIHPSPAKRQEPVEPSGQTGGGNRDISGQAHRRPPDVRREQARTDQGLPRAPGADQEKAG